MKRLLLIVCTLFVIILLSACTITQLYKSCVDRINTLRATEGLPALVWDQGQQACSDNDAKVNYQTNTPHKSNCGLAQNECPAFSSSNDILDTCIQKEMYDAEKLCYAKNPSTCYYDTACMCGHYVNMMDKNNYGYTKVACGVFYDLNSKVYKVVINFFK
jgi:hypothetical protein